MVNLGQGDVHGGRARGTGTDRAVGRCTLVEEEGEVVELQGRRRGEGALEVLT